MGADLADMQLISKFNKGFRFLLCVIDIFIKYAWVIPLKDKKGVSIVNAFQSILKQSNRKPNKIWVDKGSEFYNSSFKKWLQDNDIAIYSAHNEGKTDLKNISYVDVSSFALKSNLANLKTEVDKLDIDKLTHVPNYLAKLSNVVKMMLLKD